MVAEQYPVGLQMDVSYPNFKVSLTLLSATQLTFEIKEGPLARTETVDIQVVPIGNSIFAVSWQEGDGATVNNIQDFDRCQVLSFATLPSGQFMRMTGPLVVTRPPDRVADDRPQRNKALVLDAMTSLFQRRDAASVERLYAPAYIQHNPGIPQGRDPPNRRQFDVMAGPEGAFLVGDPATVAAKMLRANELLGGLSRITFQMSTASLETAAMNRSIELLGNEVAPAVRAATGHSESTFDRRKDNT